MEKSALIFELNKYVIKCGNFIFGKYNCSAFKPYSAMIDAVNMLCNTILLEDERSILKYCSLI